MDAECFGEGEVQRDTIKVSEQGRIGEMDLANVKAWIMFEILTEKLFSYYQSVKILLTGN